MILKKLFLATIFVLLIATATATPSIIDLSATDTGGFLTSSLYSLADYNNKIYISALGGIFAVYDPITNITSDLSTTDTDNWVATSNLQSMTVLNNRLYVSTNNIAGSLGYYNETTNTLVKVGNGNSWWTTGNDWITSYDNHIYMVGASSKFIKYNPITNTTTDLSTKDTGDWIGTQALRGVSVLNNDQVYFIGSTGVFGYYNASSDTSVDLRGVDSGDWIGTSILYSLYVQDSSHIYIGGANGVFGVYNSNTGVLTDLRTTDAGDWVGTSILRRGMDSIDDVLYVGLMNGKYGKYNSTSNVFTDLSGTDVGDWIGGTSAQYSVLVVDYNNIYFGMVSGLFGKYSENYVLAGNTAPYMNVIDVISGFVSPNAQKNVNATLFANAGDDEMDILTFEWYVDGVLQGETSNTFIWNTGKVSKNVNITVVVSDGEFEDSMTEIYNVINQESTITGTSPDAYFTVTQGDVVNFVINVSDPDGDNITYELYEYDGSYTLLETVVDDSILLDTTGFSFGNHTIEMWYYEENLAWDGFDFYVWTMNVEEGNAQPIINNYFPSLNIVNKTQYDDNVTFYINATDSNLDPLTYKWFKDGVNLLISTNYYEVSFDEFDSYVLKAMVTDGLLGVNRTWTVNVEELINNEPVISNEVPSTVMNSIYPTQSIGFSIDASDLDNDTLYYQWDVNNVTQSGEETDTFTFNAEIINIGLNEVSVYVTDGFDVVSYTWYVDVVDANYIPQYNSQDIGEMTTDMFGGIFVTWKGFAVLIGLALIGTALYLMVAKPNVSVSKK